MPDRKTPEEIRAQLKAAGLFRHLERGSNASRAPACKLDNVLKFEQRVAKPKAGTERKRFAAVLYFLIGMVAIGLTLHWA